MELSALVSFMFDGYAEFGKPLQKYRCFFQNVLFGLIGQTSRERLQGMSMQQPTQACQNRHILQTGNEQEQQQLSLVQVQEGMSLTDTK